MVRDQDDELAQTATAEGATPSPPGAAVPVGATVGRYLLERELGVGGMGVVHVAFDPDLERRVALKLLRAHGSDAAKRLQREARAMARLTHPNVVTVHEVGTAAGRDYVAMELIDGETLAEWLRSTQREPHEILEAFIAAGRGLAAAHDAGIVHRDFKPHNVLRSRKGRVAVTDFGLARESHVQGATDPLEATLPIAADSASGGSRTPSSLAGLTVTGSVLGTPAYMAPEQWTGGAVTPATDQFGFCVALWEAFTGKRPFVGPSVEELRHQVSAGPELLDASKLPRRLRSVLRRGLDPDPKLRWPSMHVLIARLGERDRRTGAVLLGAGAALAAVIVLFVLRSSGGPATPKCVRPVIEPDAMWNDAVRMTLAKGSQAGQVRNISADVQSWTEARAKACASDVGALTCLDGVMVRLDAVVHALTKLGDVPFVDAGGFLIDPARCLRTPTPRLSVTPSPALIDALATRLREDADPRRPSREMFDTLIQRVGKEPCASALAQLVGLELRLSTEDRDKLLARAEQDAETCGDDRIRAEVALAVADSALEAGFLAEARLATVRRAEAAVQRVSQPDLVANIELLRAAIAGRLGDFEQAITRSDAAASGFAARHRSEAQIIASLVALEYRRLGGRPEDLVNAVAQLGQWRELAVARAGEDSPLVRGVDRSLAEEEAAQGDLAAAAARFAKARRPVPQEPARSVTGKVVDERGAPVAGAKVALGSLLLGMGASPAVHTSGDGSYRETTSAADGSFVIADAPQNGVVIAWLEGRRAVPVMIADQVELRLGETSRLEGKIDLAGTRWDGVTVTAGSARQAPSVPYAVLAAVHPDGRFELEGVPRGKAQISTALRSSLVSSRAEVSLDVRDPIHRSVAR